MAVSAFRSTTKRSQIGPAENSGPSSPGSRIDNASQKGSHRRSRSTTDFSQRYFSDSPSTSEYHKHGADNRRQKGRSFDRHVPSDSESDIEGPKSHQRYRQRKIEINDGRDCAPPVGASGVDHPQHSFRRTSSHHDLSQHAYKCFSRCGLRGDHPEGHNEEKNFGASLAQIKSLRTYPPTEECNTVSLSDPVCSEIQHAVAQIRTELEQCMKNNRPFVDRLGHFSEDTGTDVIQAVTNIRKEFAAKLEQSEKRVGELWLQLAVEERRCLELAKIVAELCPVPNSSSNRKVLHKRKGSAEKQFVSKNLDEEAHKYFEECVSISGLDCPGDDLLHETDQLFQSTENTSHMEVSENWNKAAVKALNHGTGKNMIVQNMEKMYSRGHKVEGNSVAPRPQMEAVPRMSEKNLTKEGEEFASPTSRSGRIICSTSSNDVTSDRRLSFDSSSTGGFSNTETPTSSVQYSTNVGSDCLTPSSKTGAAGGGYISSKQNIYGKDLQASFTTVREPTHGERREVQNVFPLDAEHLMLEKISFRNRIEHGELIVCQNLILYG